MQPQTKLLTPKIIALMIYYFFMVAAVLLTFVCVSSSFFSSEFLRLKFRNKIFQAICRSFLVIALVSLMAAAFVEPGFVVGASTPPGTLATIVCIFAGLVLYPIAGLIYYALNIIAICLIALVLIVLKDALKKLCGWIFFDDKRHFFEDDDD